jgi:hypothetical protein
MSKKVQAALGVGTGLICFATVLIAYLIHKKGEEGIPSEDGDCARKCEEEPAADDEDDE